MDRTLFLDMDGWDIHVVRPRDGKGFRPAPGAASSARPTIGRVVVLDQLEEVVDLEPAARDVFCAAVLALLERSAPVAVRDATIGIDDDVKLIATIRDDLEWRVDREAPALRPLLERRIIVKGIDVNLAKSIIEEPARTLGYEVEGATAVTRDVEECLSAEPAKLPVVQYALSEWWERRDDVRKVLPVAAWNELGGVDGALSFVAERFFSALDHDQQQRVKALFIQLFQGGRKQPLAESALASGDRFMMAELGRLRLVGRHDKKGSEPFYEVEHEYLSANWARLAGWLAEARDDRALAEELERDAAAYLRDQDPERLWRKGRLAAAVEMARRGRIVLEASATQFLQHARRRERRGRFFLRASIGVGVAALLGVVYVLVLQSAATDAAAEAKEKAVIERQSAEEKNRRASQRETNAKAVQERATKDADLRIKNANDKANRITEETERRVKNVNDEIEQAKVRAQAQLKEAVARRLEQEKRANQWAKWAQNSADKAEDAEKQAKRAEQRAEAAEKRVKAACGGAAARADQ
jgi:hypothetical protein